SRCARRMCPVTDEIFAQQRQAFGVSVADLAAGAQQVLGLPPQELPGLLGVSEPMFAALVAGTRSRIGNPVATGRLLQLRELIDQVATGAPSRADVPLALAQIRASTIPAVPGEVTARVEAPAAAAPAHPAPPTAPPTPSPVPTAPDPGP